RSHSPLIANVIVLIVTLIYLALIVWGSSKFLEIFFTAGMAELLTFFVVPIAAIAFPFTPRALYDGPPIKQSIAGIPVLAIVGVLALAVYVLFFYPLATNDTLGANTTTGWVATAIIAGIGILLYPISYFVNRARGVDLGLAFKQLPPEQVVRRSKQKATRLFFATDVHGSEQCFRKFVNAAKVYEVSALILGGDVTGKVVVPLVANGDGSWHGELYGDAVSARGDEELADLQK